MALTVYRKNRNKPISSICPEERMSNQVTITGSDGSFPVANGYFFLELGRGLPGVFLKEF